MPDTPLAQSPTFESGGFRIPIWRSVAVAVLFTAVIVVCLSGSDPNSETQAGVEMELPEWVGAYRGEEQDVSAAELKILPDDTQFARKVYNSPSGKTISCQIVLAGGQRRSIHRPEVCLPGQGWNINAGEVMDVVMPQGDPLKVMKLNLTRPVQVGPDDTRQLRMVFLYWFVGKGATTPHHWNRILLTSYDRVLHNLNHRWAYVVVSSVVAEDVKTGGLNEEETVEMLKDFIREAVPQFQHTDSDRGPTS